MSELGDFLARNTPPKPPIPGLPGRPAAGADRRRPPLLGGPWGATSDAALPERWGLGRGCPGRGGVAAEVSTSESPGVNRGV